MATVVGTDNSRVLRATCGNCASIIEYTASELVPVTTRDISGVSDTDYKLTCPKCHDQFNARRY